MASPFAAKTGPAASPAAPSTADLVRRVDPITIQVFASRLRAPPGGSLRLAVAIDVDDGWHLYAPNPEADLLIPVSTFQFAIARQDAAMPRIMTDGTGCAAGDHVLDAQHPGGGVVVPCRPAEVRQRSGVYVVIPARNEAESLPLVLRDLPPVGGVVVVDNGSTDRTATVAHQGGAVVVPEQRPGYGSACLAGLAQLAAWAEAGEISPEVVVFLDADYSDHPELLPRLADPILAGQADFVLGSRLLGEREVGAMPPQSVYGNRLACLLMRLLWNVRFTDLGPFRAIRYASLRQLRMEDRNFGWTVEMQIKAAVAELRTLEVPVPYRRRIGTSKISGTLTGTVKAGAKILYTIAKYGWKTRSSQRPTNGRGPQH